MIEKAAIQTITPSRARELIANSAPNRNLRPDYVSMLARAITAGEWQMNGQAIIISKTGKLLDGQHRMHAVVKSDRSIKTVVTSGVLDTHFESIDTGNIRTTKDVLKLKGYHRAAQIGATVQQLHLWQMRGIVGPHFWFKLRTVEVVHSVPLLDQNLLGIVIESALEVSKVMKRTAMLAAIGYISGSEHYGKFASFCGLFKTGEGLSAGHPILTLRERIFSETDRAKIPPVFLGFAVAKAYLHFVNGKQLTVIRRHKTEDFPAIPGEKDVKLPWVRPRDWRLSVETGEVVRK